MRKGLLTQNQINTLTLLKKNRDFAELLNDFLRQRKTGSVCCGAGNYECSVFIEEGRIIDIKEKLLNDVSDYKDKETIQTKTVQEMAYEFYLKLYTMKKGGTITEEQVNRAEKALKEAENKAIAQLMPVFDGVAIFIVQDAKKEGRRKARQKIKGAIK